MFARIACSLPLCLAAAAVGAAELTYLAPTAGDRVPDALVALPKGGAPALPALNDRREPVTFAWAVDSTALSDLTSGAAPFVAESRQYFLDVTGAELAAGVVLRTTAPRALVRLSPGAGTKHTAVDLGAVVIRAAGRELAGEAAAEVFVDAGQMKAIGVGFSEGTIALRLAAVVGAGAIELRVPTLAKAAAGRFVVQVFEPESPYVLRASAREQSFFAGEVVQIELAAPGLTLNEDRLTGWVSAPDGTQAARLRFRRDPRGTLVAEAPKLAAASAGAGGLFEANVFLDTDAAGQRVLRDVRTAFALVVPTARLLARPGKVELGAGGLRFDIPVEAAVAGRFEARGVLFGSLADGTMIPVAIGHSAAWLPAGAGALAFAVEPEVLAASVATAPYELRHFALQDQSRLQQLWRQDRAFVIRP